MSRVDRADWGVARAAIVLIIAFTLPFSGGDLAIESMPVAAAFVLLAALLALLVPVVVASSPTTNVPIVYETFVCTITSAALVVVLVRMVWHPGDGLDFGAWLAALAAFLTCLAAWRSIGRGG